MHWNIFHKDWAQYIGLLLFNILLVFVVCHYFGFRFEDNDDIAMCMIANGMYTGSPDCHLVFINAIYGSLLSGLYNLVSIVEWYTWSFLFLHVCAMAIIVKNTIQAWQKHLPLGLAFILLFYVIWITWLQLIQFTTTAAICALAGCVLLQRKRGAILACIFILLGSLIRFEAAALVVLIFIPLFFYTYRTAWKSYAVLCVIGLIVLCAKGADNLFYQSTEWQYYKEWNAIRGTLNDNPSFGYVNAMDIDASLCEEDVQLLGSFFADPNVWTMPLIKKAQQVTKQDNLVKRFLQVERWKQYTKYVATLCVLFLLSILCCMLLPEYRWIVAGISVWLLLVLLYVALNGTLKDRVFLVTVFTFVVCISLIISKMRWGGYVLVALPLLLLSGKYSKRFVKRIDAVNERRQYLMEEQYTLIQSVSSSWAIIPTNMWIECVNPLCVSDIKADYYMNGWMTNFAAKGYKSFAEFIDQPIGVLIKREDTDKIAQVILSTIKKHYSQDVTYDIVVENETYRIINFLSSKQ